RPCRAGRRARTAAAASPGRKPDVGGSRGGRGGTPGTGQYEAAVKPGTGKRGGRTRSSSGCLRAAVRHHGDFGGWPLFRIGASLAELACGSVPSLKGGGRTLSGARQGLRSGLVVAEAALALVLLVAAGLFLRSFA